MPASDPDAVPLTTWLAGDEERSPEIVRRKTFDLGMSQAPGELQYYVSRIDYLSRIACRMDREDRVSPAYRR